MGRQLSLRYYHVILVRLEAPTCTQSKKCEISHWCSCGADGRVDAGGRASGRTDGRLRSYQNFSDG